MTRILLRAFKGPFRAASPSRALDANLIGDNAGNIIFSDAVFKLLRTRDTEVDIARLQTGREDAAHINAEYDAVVFPLANAFRPSFVEYLEPMTDLIEQLRIPVVILGVGAQLGANGSFTRLEPIAPLVRRFVSAVLERSPTIGVRGELTYDYLTHLGFRDVEVIGCPSLFMYGPDFRVEKSAARLTPESDIAINITPYVKAMGPVVRHHLERYPNLRYIAQDKATLSMMLRREGSGPEAGEGFGGDLPTYRGHPLIAQDHTRFFVDPKPWFEYLGRFDFSFGTRIHGNIASLLAGTPSYVFAHDSRTLELARYFEIPHREMREVTSETDAAELYEEADYAAFNSGQRKRFDAFARFIEQNGLSHVYAPGEDPDEFEREIAGIEFYPGAGSFEQKPTLTRRVRRRSRRIARAVSEKLNGPQAEVIEPWAPDVRSRRDYVPSTE